MKKKASATPGNPGFFLWAVLLLAAALAHAFPDEARTDGNFPGDGGGYWMPGGGNGFPGWPGGGIPGYPGGGIPGYPGGGGMPGYPGGGFPGGPGGKGWGGNMGGGWGAGYGGPRGGYARGGVVRPSVVCRERGPCHGMRLTCPAQCFSSYSHSGKNYGYGGGGGGCTIDCSKTCTAHC